MNAEVKGGSAEHWPTSADGVRNFVGGDFISIRYGRADQAPDENDVYTMSGHDLISAIRNWRVFVLSHDA